MQSKRRSQKHSRQAKTISVLVLAIAAIVFLAGCKRSLPTAPPSFPVTIEAKIDPPKNPTVYEFNSTVGEVQIAIKEINTHRGELLIWKMARLDELKNIFEKPENENDAYFYISDPIGRSRVYFKNGQPLESRASFHIHLVSVNESRTRVEIYTYDSMVCAGLDPHGVHGPARIEVAVDPTTIEEYEILLQLGKQLGAKDMPAVVLPKHDAPTRTLTKQRQW